MAEINGITRASSVQNAPAVERNTQQARSNRQEALTVSRSQADRVTISQQAQQRQQTEASNNRQIAQARTRDANEEKSLDAQRSAERRRDAQATEDQAQQRRIDQAAQAPAKAAPVNRGSNIDTRA